MTTAWRDTNSSLDSDMVTNLSGVTGLSVTEALDALNGAIGGVVTNDPPEDVTRSAAVVGVSTEAARADHKHNIDIDSDDVTNASGVAGALVSDALDALATSIATEASTRSAADLLLAPLASPVFTGNPTAPTPTPGDADTSIATTAFVTGAVAAIPATSWGTITGTLSSQSDLQSALNLKAPLASPAFTGSPTAPTQPVADSSTLLATTAYVQAVTSTLATKDTPAFIGVPTAPTAAPGTNTTQLATTAFVAAAITAQPAASFAELTGDPSDNGALDAALSDRAPLISPSFSGDPLVPTASPGDNDFTIANTAFVTAADVLVAANRPRVYNSSGLVSAPKIWVGTASINATGAWSASITSASFASVISVSATAQRNTATVIQQPVTTVLTISTSTVTGQCWDGRTNIGTGDTVEVTTNGAPTTTVQVIVFGT